AQVDGEFHDRAAVLPQIDGSGRITPAALVLDARRPDATHRLLHPVDEPGVAEAAAVEERLVAFLDAIQLVGHGATGDWPERLAGSIERKRQRSAVPRRSGRKSGDAFRSLPLRLRGARRGFVHCQSAPVAAHRLLAVALRD